MQVLVEQLHQFEPHFLGQRLHIDVTGVEGDRLDEPIVQNPGDPCPQGQIGVLDLQVSASVGPGQVLFPGHQPLGHVNVPDLALQHEGYRIPPADIEESAPGETGPVDLAAEVLQDDIVRPDDRPAIQSADLVTFQITSEHSLVHQRVPPGNQGAARIAGSAETDGHADEILDLGNVHAVGKDVQIQVPIPEAAAGNPHVVPVQGAVQGRCAHHPVVDDDLPPQSFQDALVRVPVHPAILESEIDFLVQPDTPDPVQIRDFLGKTTVGSGNLEEGPMHHEVLDLQPGQAGLLLFPLPLLVRLPGPQEHFRAADDHPAQLGHDAQDLADPEIDSHGVGRGQGHAPRRGGQGQAHAIQIQPLEYPHPEIANLQAALLDTQQMPADQARNVGSRQPRIGRQPAEHQDDGHPGDQNRQS